MSLQHQNTLSVRDIAAWWFAWGSAAIVGLAGVWLIGEMLFAGANQLSWSLLFTEPSDAGRAGGLGPMLISTLLIIGVCMVVSLPIGLGTAVVLSEMARSGPRSGWLIRQSLNVLAGVPSIVFGLFGNAFFCTTLGLGYSIWSGGLTLACMVLPILVRLVEEGLRSVPDEYRLGAAALGLSQTTTLTRVVLPVAAPAVAAAFVLSVGRAMAETAALIFTSGYADRFPRSLSDSGRSLSVHVYELAMNVPGGYPRAYTTAALLVLLLLVINAATWGLMRLALQQRPTTNPFWGISQ